MKSLCVSIFISSFFLVSLLGTPPLYEQKTFARPSNRSINEPQLIINNRPLAKVRGKVISLYDVIKQINLALFELAPTYTPSAFERYRIYSSRWEPTLDEMIANELILLDAENRDIKISDGEVREKFLSRLGPNVHENLDRVNLEYEEARHIMHSDLVIQKLLDLKVHAKTLQIVTPKTVKEEYERYLKDHPPTDEWKYQVLSIRGEDKNLCECLAEKAYLLLTQEEHSLTSVVTLLQEKNATISVSKEFSKHSNKISKLHFDIIKTLTPNTISSPVLQTSTFDNKIVFRIFHLKEITHILPTQFCEMYDTLKHQLLCKTYNQEKELYIHSLKKRFGYNKHDPKITLPEDYLPFFIL